MHPGISGILALVGAVAASGAALADEVISVLEPLSRLPSERQQEARELARAELTGRLAERVTRSATVTLPHVKDRLGFQFGRQRANREPVVLSLELFEDFEIVVQEEDFRVGDWSANCHGRIVSGANGEVHIRLIQNADADPSVFINVISDSGYFNVFPIGDTRYHIAAQAAPLTDAERY